MAKTEEKKHKSIKNASAVWKPMVLVVAVAILVFGIPIGINEAYKAGAGYVTMWGAAEVLSFYGSVLGAVVTAASLFATIWFTRKQIARDKFLERNRDKWEKVDSIITKSMIDISPLNMCNSAKLDGTITSNLQTIILNLQSYAITAKTSLNLVKCYVGPPDYEKIGDFIRVLQDSIEQFCKIENDLANEYLALQTIASNYGGIVPSSELLEHLNRATEINKKIPTAHDKQYQYLLNLKREVFERIYSDIEKQAENMLLFVRRK